VHHKLKVPDYELIVASLLHDNVEDFPEIWSLERVKRCFGARVAKHVDDVSKPPKEQFGGNRELRDEVYHRRLLTVPRESKLLKLADRLHNHITMSGVGEKKWRRKVRETREFYIQQLAEPEGIFALELREACDYMHYASRHGDD
jgi:(p)ppGpp synthase/HD superfamily hydrolase